MIGEACYLKTGIFQIGKIIGIVDSRTFNYVKLAFCTNWDRLYPGWREKPVYYIEFQWPQKTSTFKEYCEWDSNVKNPAFQAASDELKYAHYMTLPEKFIVSAPLDDVVVMYGEKIHDLCRIGRGA